MKKLTILVLALLLVPVAGRAQEDACAFDKTLQEFFDSPPILDELTIKVKDETKAKMMDRANDDGLTDDRVDLLRRAFIALDLGEVTDEKGAIVFNFNPTFLDSDIAGQFSPRFVVHEASLFAPLDEKISTLPEDRRQNTKDALSKDLSDFDDVEFRLRWTPVFGTPSKQLETVAADIFTPVYKATFQAEAAGVADDVAHLTRDIENAGLDPAQNTITEICANQNLRTKFLKIADRLNTKTATALGSLSTKLADQFFFDLADLIEGQPKLIGEGSLRYRQDAAGPPHEGTASLRFEIGPRSYWGWNNWAKKNNKALDAKSAQEYLKGFQGTLPLVSLTVDYTDTSDFKIPLPLPEGTETFSQDGGRKISAALQGGIYLGTSRAHRLSLEAKYDWASSDRPDRFVSTLTWTEKPDAALGEAVKRFTGGSDIVVSLVYANKPEFRGQVDEEFGMRAGLKWSFGGAKN